MGDFGGISTHGGTKNHKYLRELWKEDKTLKCDKQEYRVELWCVDGAREEKK